MTLSPGFRLGPYEVLSKLGEGGMGEVYRARDTTLDRDVALKVLPEAMAADPDRLMRFEREAKSLAALNHPNIAQIYGLEQFSAGRPGGQTSPVPDGGQTPSALVLEYVEGEDLSLRLARGALAPDEALLVARQIVSALEAAHDAGIIHRDLKPSNIKVSDEGRVKVLDFGLAKAMEPDAGGAGARPADAVPSRTSDMPTMTSPAMTAMGMILGTAAYMSPEQARGRAVDKRADIWAFGVVMYEALTGERLFPGDTVSDTIASVLTRDPDLSRVPATWRRLLGRCLRKDVRHRLRDIGDAWLLMDDETGTPDPRTRPAVRSVALWAVTALLIGAVGTWTAMRLTSEPPPTSAVSFLEPPPPGTQFVTAPEPSPDGRHLAMLVRDAAGETNIWVRTLDADMASVLEGTEGTQLLFWSPASDEIAFFASGQLRRIHRDGGPASLITADAEIASGAWTSSGDIVVSLLNRGLAHVAAAGGTLQPISGTDAGFVRHLDPNMIPGHLIFTQFGGETGLYASALDGSNRRRLVPGVESRTRLVGDVLVRDNAGVLIGQMLNRADVTLVGDPFPITEHIGSNAFAGSPAGVLTYVHSDHVVERLTWFSRSGEPEGTAGPEGEFREVLLSGRQRWLVFVQQDPSVGTADVWSQELSGGEPVRLTSDPGIDHLLAISPDEREVAWEAHAGGALNVMARPLDASASARLLRQWGRGGGPTDWSPDGGFLLYGSIDLTNGNNLWAVPLTGPDEPFALVEDEFDDRAGHFSPDGRWLAYVSNASGRDEVYLQRLDGLTRVGGPRRVSRTGGREPLWRGDSRELFFLSDQTIVAVEIRDDERVTGAPRALFAIERLRLKDRSYAVTPDGQRFLAIVGTADVAPRPATVILNWSPPAGR